MSEQKEAETAPKVTTVPLVSSYNPYLYGSGYWGGLGYPYSPYGLGYRNPLLAP